MRLSLINPSNSLVNIVRLQERRLNRYRVWQPLSLVVLAGLTPPEWDATLVDENTGIPHYHEMPVADRVTREGEAVWRKVREDAAHGRGRPGDDELRGREQC